MARQRTVKYPLKRGKFTRRQIQRAVDKVIHERLEREAATLKTQTNTTIPMTSKLSLTETHTCKLKLTSTSWLRTIFV